MVRSLLWEVKILHPVEIRKDTVEVYDIARDEWIENEIPPMPLPLDHTASAVYDGKIT